MSQLSISLRPRKLSEVYGQSHIINNLGKRLKVGDCPQSILLKGMSGTGKTSVAQIIAMTLNCSSNIFYDVEKGVSFGDPCGECPSCKGILEERFDRDTHRLDGTASSKEELIDFSTLANVSPMYDKNNVFIIEESDALSPKAKSALLKVIEKPMKNTYFILLSMINMGIPMSIQSRCQTFNFRPFTRKDVMMALREMLIRIGKWDSPDIPKTFYTEVIPVISDVSQGSLRSAVQFMETCLTSDLYTETEVRKELGVVSAAAVFEMLVSLLQLKKEFFEQFENVDIQEFFNLSYTILTSAAAYRISSYVKNEYYEEQTKALSKENNMVSLLKVFDEIATAPYLKKNFMVSKFSQYFNTALPPQVEAKSPARRRLVE